ncbi:MAG TPA: hypothetical protein VFV17_08800, partial [Usitatibacteraceae bacterium]|nr:hypothetical protein [Usitatibacteraceae bacterium]
PRTPDEQLAANQQPSAGIYRMRGIHEKQVISPKGVAAWYARMALAEIEEFVVPFGRRYGCDAPVQADFPVRRPVAGNSVERGSYQCKQLGPGLALLAADRKRSGIVDYASGAPDGPANTGEADAEPVVAATTELTNRHEMAVDTGWPQRVANAQTDVSESGKAQARTVIRRVYLRQ